MSSQKLGIILDNKSVSKSDLSTFESQWKSIKKNHSRTVFWKKYLFQVNPCPQNSIPEVMLERGQEK